MFANGLHAELRDSLEAIGASVAVLEQSGPAGLRVVSANALFGEVTGGDVGDLIDKAFSEVLPRHGLAVLTPAINACLSRGAPSALELALDQRGETLWWRVLLSPIIAHRGAAGRVILTAIDITAKKRLEQSLEVSRNRHRALVNSAYDGIVSINDAQEIQLINRAGRQMFGIAEDADLTGVRLETLLPKRFRGKHQDYLAAFKTSPIESRGMHTRAAVTGLRRDGVEFPLEVTIAKIRVGEATEMTAVMRDVSERARLIEELKIAATIDPLTGTANQRKLNEALAYELGRARRFGRHAALLLIDIDHFKQVNDRYGHAAGDAVLVELAARMRTVLREVDVLGRWGGEEFVALLPETSLAAAADCAERIRGAVAERPFVGGEALMIPLSVSVGATLSAAADLSSEPLIARADKALYCAKDGGRNQVVTLLADSDLPED